jgi:hypothetical protein
LGTAKLILITATFYSVTPQPALFKEIDYIEEYGGTFTPTSLSGAATK